MPPAPLAPTDLAEHDLDDRPGDPVVTLAWLGAPALSYARRPASVLAVLDRAVARWPDRTALVEGERTLTYAELAQQVETAARALVHRGLAPGDAVAVCAGNGLETAVALFACARARLVLVGLSTRLAPPQWEPMCEHMGVRLRLATPGHPLPQAEDLATVLGEGGPPVDWTAPDEAATYAVVFTSGTTGRPKASQVVHRASVHSAMSYQRVLQLGPADVTAVLFPLTYISAMHAHVLPAMLAGAACVLLDTTSPTTYVQALRTHAVSWAYAVPSWWRMCLRVEAFRDLPALRRIGAGGAPFPVELQQELRERLPGVLLHDVYGLSETHSPACIATDADLLARPHSVGRPLPCLQAQVRSLDGDDEGAVLGAGEPGALWLRGSLVTTGYARDAVATAAAIVDGWFDTGDVARIDDDGSVVVLDRTKDMVNRGGAKVFSAEVEALLRRHPAVDDVAVVAVPDPVAGEAVAAYVVASGPVSAAEVRAWVRDGLAEHAAPRKVVFLEALPRNAVGKTDKQALRGLPT